MNLLTIARKVFVCPLHNPFRFVFSLLIVIFLPYFSWSGLNNDFNKSDSSYHTEPLYFPASGADNSWQYMNSSDNSNPSSRHECGYIEVGGKFYLIGGRGNPALNVYDPANNKWSSVTNIPNGKELHHFQPVNYNGKIYIMGAFTGGFPSESPVADIYIFNPSSGTWSVLANQIPSGRRRGAAGVAVYNNKIYLIGGIRNGHTDGWVNWVDEFDPETLTWKILPDAPHQRDHFQAVVYNNKIYVTGGRKSSYPNTINITESSVDVYTFSSQSWSTLPSSSNIPTPRAGTATVLVNNEIFVVAGESGNNGYHREVEAFNPATNTWRTLPATLQGRNGPGGLAYNGKIFLVAGVVNGNEVSTQEVFTAAASAPDPNPTVASALPDLNVNKNAAASQKSIAAVFNDDEGSGNLIYSVSGNTNNTLVTATIINSSVLQLSYSTDKTGTSMIKIRATDSDGNIADDEFRIDVTEPPPPGATSMLINCGGSAVSFNGQTWMTDQYYSSGSAYSSSNAINGTTNDAIYQKERFGNNFGYAIPLSPGIYIIKLHFAEIYWTAAGNRVFNVNVENGKGILNNFDIYSEAGTNSALIKEFLQVSVTDGTLNIDFTMVKDNAKISGIEIIGSGSTNTCGVPVNPSSSNITSKTAVLKWDAVSGAQQYQVEYKASTVSTWTIASASLSTNTFTLSNLGSNTTYNCRVQAACSSGKGNYATALFTTIIPAANAGADKSMTLPTQSVTLNGSGSVSNGTISSYVWSQSSGPTTATFSSKTVAAPAVSSLSAGTYAFSLVVTDNNGGTSLPNQVTVTVKSSNQAPVASAGGDKNITLPTSSTTLSGSGVDSDGTVATYLWAQTSGPNTANFSSKTVAAPAVSGLIGGTYIFNLKVTDNEIAQSTADPVNVIVNTAPAGQQVISFTLVNANTNIDISGISNGAVLNLSALPTSSLNIRANTNPGTVGRVVLNMNGPSSRSVTETVAPYALYGDNSGDYNAWTPSPGSYSLTATPYTTSGGGTTGNALTISFTVVNNSSNRTINSSQSVYTDEGYNQRISEQNSREGSLMVAVSPNPATNIFNLKLNSGWKESIAVTVVDWMGKTIEIRKGVIPGSNLQLGSGYSKGIYFIQVTQGGDHVIRKLIKQ